MENLSQDYRVSPAIWDHTVLPATLHRRTCPILNPAREATRPVLSLPTLEWWKAELTFAYMLYLSADTDSHPSK